jgi:hypothetical protein
MAYDVERVAVNETSYLVRFDGHAGVVLPRVTSTLGVLNPFAGIPEDVLAAAALRGRIVHHATHLLDNGDGLAWETVREDHAGYVRAYEAWKAAAGATITATEVFVASQRWRVAGTLDKLASGIDRRFAVEIVDLKTGAPQAGHAWQTAAYAEAWREQTGYKGSLGRVCVYLGPGGRFRMVRHTEADDLAAFLACVTIYNKLQRRAAK